MLLTEQNRRPMGCGPPTNSQSNVARKGHASKEGITLLVRSKGEIGEKVVILRLKGRDSG